MWHCIRDEQGFSLLEAMIAVLVIAVGVLAVMTMQIQSIKASSTAQFRTSANDAAVSVLESLKHLSFDDPVLAQTAASLPSQHDPSPANRPILGTNARLLTSGVDANGDGFPDPPAWLDRVFRVSNAAPELTDISGKGVATYQLARISVVDNVLPTGEVPTKTIRLFLSWTSSMGNNFAELTAIKYRNISL